jgi:hypothetical protein
MYYLRFLIEIVDTLSRYLNTLDKAVRLNPEFSEALYWKAQVLHLQDKPQLALKTSVAPDAIT